MESHEGTLEGAGGIAIAWRAWSADVPDRGVVVIVHDAGDHGGRFATIVEAVVPLGFPVLAPDLRGHGRSGGERGDIGGIDAALGDIGLALEHARVGHPGVPAFLLGQGMGGALAIAYALRRPLDGLIVFAPMLAAPRPGPVDATALSRDQAVVRAYEEDPLVLHDGLAAPAIEALAAEIATFESRAGELGAPLLVMHGYADRLADPEASRALHKRAGSEDKVLVLWDGLFHEIHHEPAEDRELPLERLADWLGDHAG